MIIAVNTRILSGNEENRLWLIECIKQVAIKHPEHQFVFIAEKEIAINHLPNTKSVILPQQSLNPVFWKIWYNYTLPAACKKIKADVLISADGICSLRMKLPQLLLVNDPSIAQYSEWFSKKYIRFTEQNAASFFDKAKLLVTLSQAAKKTIIEKYPAGESKIKVIHAAPVHQYSPISWEEKEAVKEKYAEGKEYFLFNGAIHPRSNLLNLLKAFSLFKKRQKSNMQLIIASTEESEDDLFINSISTYKYRSEVKVLSSITEQDMAALVTSAYACINTGPLHSDITFLLNAVQSNVPVIAGNLYSAMELLKDAALFAEASVPENIAEKLMLLYKDENRRNELVSNAAELSKKYRLSETATQLWQNIQLAAESA